MSTTLSPLAAGLRLSRPAALAVLATAMFVIILDSSMVNLAASTIRTGLELSATELTAMANGYLVALAGLMLLGGRLADVLGGRRMFVIGMATYVTASAVSALAVNGPMLLAGRIGQGIGAALAVPAALTLVLLLFPTPAERTRAMGVWGAVAGAGSLVGVFLGGTLTQILGWQSVFWAPVPLGIVAIATVLHTVPAVPGRAGQFDAAGALTITTGVSSLALGLLTAAGAGWSSASTLAPLGIGIASLLAFVVVERRTAHPLVPLGVFRRPPLMIAAGVMVLGGATLASLFFFLPLYQQEVLGMDALTTGMTQIPLAVMIIVGSALAPLLAQWLGLRGALPAGLAILLAGLAWLALNSAPVFGWQHLVAFVLIGTGLGLSSVNAIAMGVRDSADEESGLLSGLVNAAQQLGGAVGLAALAGIAIGSVGAAGEVSFTTAFLGGAALVLIALALSLLPTGGRRRIPARVA